jgi:hypothetical protein
MQALLRTTFAVVHRTWTARGDVETDPRRREALTQALADVVG